MNDMSSVIIPKSDQINADDLIAAVMAQYRGWTEVVLPLIETERRVEQEMFV